MQDILSALRRAQGSVRPWALCDALASAGRSYRSLGALGPAQVMFEQSLRWSRLSGSADLTIDLLCELCETFALLAEDTDAGDDAALRGARDSAREHAFDAVQLAEHAADARWEVTVLLRVSDLFDRLGDHDEAVELQVRALRQMSEPGVPDAPDASTAHGTLH